MKILMLTANDPAGMGIVFCRAINRFSEHSCRLVTTEERYGFDYEKDIHLPDCTDDDFTEIEHLLLEADIIHFHILSDEEMRLGPLSVKNYTKSKKIVHHHHGHPDFRANPAHYEDKYKRLKRKMLVSTPDLLKRAPSATWIPNLVPVNDPLYTPAEQLEEEVITIGQAPTRKDLKNTAELQEVVAKLQSRIPGKKIVLKIIESMPHTQCLEEKRRCHIIFDHMQGYYGVSSLESLSQGKPVIAGIDAWNQKHIAEFTKTDELPWCVARTKEQLQDTISHLVNDHELRITVGRRSRLFMEQHWSPSRVVDRLVNVYDSL